MNNITGPTEAPDSPPAEIIDVVPEQNEDETEVPTQNQTTTKVVTYSHTVSEVAEETAQSPWLFLILGVTTLGAGAYYFTRG